MTLNFANSPLQSYRCLSLGKSQNYIGLPEKSMRAREQQEQKNRWHRESIQYTQTTFFWGHQGDFLGSLLLESTDTYLALHIVFPTTLTILSTVQAIFIGHLTLAKHCFPIHPCQPHYECHFHFLEKKPRYWIICLWPARCSEDLRFEYRNYSKCTDAPI